MQLDETDPSENENIKEVAAMTQDGQLRAIVRLKRGQWCPYRVFPTREPE